MPENQLTTQKSGLHIPENVRLYMDQIPDKVRSHLVILSSSREKWVCTEKQPIPTPGGSLT